jgi:hypothetical protein
MRTTRLLLASSVIAVFAVFFFHTFSSLGERADVGGRAALGAFEFFGIAASLYLLSKGKPGSVSLLDCFACVIAILVAWVDLAGSSITILALYLLFRNKDDLSTKAAGTVAVAVQMLWAPLVFRKSHSYFCKSMPASSAG